MTIQGHSVPIRNNETGNCQPSSTGFSETMKAVLHVVLKELYTSYWQLVCVHMHVCVCVCALGLLRPVSVIVVISSMLFLQLALNPLSLHVDKKFSYNETEINVINTIIYLVLLVCETSVFVIVLSCANNNFMINNNNNDDDIQIIIII
jgi:hypothetical protein